MGAGRDRLGVSGSGKPRAVASAERWGTAKPPRTDDRVHDGRDEERLGLGGSVPLVFDPAAAQPRCCAEQHLCSGGGGGAGGNGAAVTARALGAAPPAEWGRRRNGTHYGRGNADPQRHGQRNAQERGPEGLLVGVAPVRLLTRTIERARPRGVQSTASYGGCGKRGGGRGVEGRTSVNARPIQVAPTKRACRPAKRPTLAMLRGPVGANAVRAGRRGGRRPRIPGLERLARRVRLPARMTQRVLHGRRCVRFCVH